MEIKYVVKCFENLLIISWMKGYDISMALVSDGSSLFMGKVCSLLKEGFICIKIKNVLKDQSKNHDDAHGEWPR